MKRPNVSDDFVGFRSSSDDFGRFWKTRIFLSELPTMKISFFETENPNKHGLFRPFAHFLGRNENWKTPPPRFEGGGFLFGVYLLFSFLYIFFIIYRIEKKTPHKNRTPP